MTKNKMKSLLRGESPLCIEFSLQFSWQYTNENTAYEG